MEFPRKEYWSGLSFPSPGDLPDLGNFPVSPALAGRFFAAKPLEKLGGVYFPFNTNFFCALRSVPC